MANVEGENPNLDALKVSGEEAVSAEPAAIASPDLAAPTGEATAEPVQAEQAETETAEVEGAKEPGNLLVYLEWGGAIGIPAIILAFAWLEVLYFSTALYAISVGFIPYGIWQGRKTNTVYTVILGCTLVAVLTAIYCLWLEVGRYRFDIKAQNAKQRVGMSQPIEAGFLVQTGGDLSAVSYRRSA